MTCIVVQRAARSLSLVRRNTDACSNVLQLARLSPTWQVLLCPDVYCHAFWQLSHISKSSSSSLMQQHLMHQTV
jgi:hypothetical protein